MRLWCVLFGCDVAFLDHFYAECYRCYRCGAVDCFPDGESERTICGRGLLWWLSPSSLKDFIGLQWYRWRNRRVFRWYQRCRLCGLSLRFRERWAGFCSAKCREDYESVPF